MMRNAPTVLLLLALLASGTPASAGEPFASRWVGTAVIGSGLGITAAIVARAACGNSENGPRDCTGATIGVGLLGAAVGGAVGNLVGRVVPRR